MSDNQYVDELRRLGNINQQIDKLIQKALKSSDDYRAQVIVLVKKTWREVK